MRGGTPNSSCRTLPTCLSIDRSPVEIVTGGRPRCQSLSTDRGDQGSTLQISGLIETIVAGIASTNTVRNIRSYPSACVFRQSGFKIVGLATVIGSEETDFAGVGADLLRMAGNDFPIRHVISIQIDRVRGYGLQAAHSFLIGQRRSGCRWPTKPKALFRLDSLLSILSRKF